MKQYVFKISSPTEPLVREQMRAAHQYRNTLVEIELERRKACEAVLLRLAPEYALAVTARDECQAAVLAALAAIKSASAKARKRVKPTAEQKQAVESAKAARKAAAIALADLKESTYARDDVQAELNGLTLAAKEKHKAARLGVYWGNYLRVDETAQGFGRGAPPRFERFTGEGTVSVQLQGGLTVADCLAGNDTRLTISVPPRLEERLLLRGSAGQSHGTATVKFRVGSEGRAPIFASVEAVMGRALPPAGVIKWAHIDCRKIASTEEWSLRLIVDEPPVRREDRAESLVAVHLGYRVMDDRSLRVATAVGSDGALRELRLPPEDIGWLAKAADLRSIRDTNFGAAKLELARWLKDSSAAPEWLREECEHLGQWKSPGRLAALLIRWRQQRFEADAAIYPALEAWRKQDKHLWLWESHGSAKLARRRKIDYRRFVKALADRYQHAVLARVQWKRLLEKPEADEAESVTNAVRARARLAAPSKLQAMLGEKFGSDCLSVSAIDISAVCHQCGSSLTDRQERLVNCESCGEIDQDHNAARATLARGQAAMQSRRSLASLATEEVSADNAVPKLSQRRERFAAARAARRKEKADKEQSTVP